MAQQDTPLYSVRCEDGDDYLTIIVEGQANPGNSMSIHNEILLLLKQTDKKYALIDRTGLAGRISVIDSIRRAESIPMAVRTKMVRTAMLDIRERMESARVEEMAMINRGAKIRTFFNMKDAVDWLHEHKHANDK